MALIQYEAPPTTSRDVLVSGVLRFLTRTRDWDEKERFMHVRIVVMCSCSCGCMASPLSLYLALRPLSTSSSIFAWDGMSRSQLHLPIAPCSIELHGCVCVD